MVPRILIVGYGNPLRCDDGIGWRAAEALEEKFSAEQVEILGLHQLAPELAHAVAERKLVLFIDAACAEHIRNSHPGEIRIRELSSEETHERQPGQFSHVYSPGKVLALARDLYHARPKAWVITIAGENFGYGECLSPPVAHALPELMEKLEQLVGSHLTGSDRELQP